MAGVGKDIKLDLLIKLLEILAISIIVIEFRNNGLEAGSVSLGLGVSGSSIGGYCGGCPYGGTSRLHRAFSMFTGFAGVVRFSGPRFSPSKSSLMV